MKQVICQWFIIVTTTILVITAAAAFSPLPTKIATPSKCSHRGVGFVQQKSFFLPYSSICLGLKAKKEDEQEKVFTPEEEALMALDAKLSSTTTPDCPTWHENIAAMLEYKKIYNTTNVSDCRGRGDFRGRACAKYPNLGSWIKHLRQRRTPLTAEQVQDLKPIGFAWQVNYANVVKFDQKWDAMYEKLLQFKKKYGHCRVSVDWKEDPTLGRWVSKQREVYTWGSMTNHRIQKLEAIDFVWRLKPYQKRDNPKLEKLWQQRYEELLQFRQEFGHCEVQNHRQRTTNWQLARWVGTQRDCRKKGLLSQERQELLHKIDFVWDYDEDRETRWLENYEKVKDGLERGHTLEEICISNAWLTDQRLRNDIGLLEPERKAMLDAIGMDWKLPTRGEQDAERWVSHQRKRNAIGLLETE